MQKKGKGEHDDEVHAEYDFSQLQGGIKGKYVGRYQAGTHLVLLTHDIAKASPDNESLNETFRQHA